jgi:hypothetical protein
LHLGLLSLSFFQARLQLVDVKLVERKEKHEIIRINGTKCTKQRRGEEPPRKATPHQMEKIMEELMKQGYSIRQGEMCHQAQEMTRRAVGLNVPGDSGARVRLYITVADMVLGSACRRAAGFPIKSARFRPE